MNHIYIVARIAQDMRQPVDIHSVTAEAVGRIKCREMQKI
jgi:hypothetical protein